MQIHRLVLVVVVLTCLANARQNTPAAQPKPCSEPEQKQLDFWVSEWANSVHRILDGCIVQENFSGADAMHLRGQSVSIFDVRAGQWKQTWWVDNEGGYLDFVGEFKDRQMSEATRPDGTKSLQRMVFKNITHDQFNWNWEASKDGARLGRSSGQFTTRGGELDGRQTSDVRPQI
jgi:hypothetical protein